MSTKTNTCNCSSCTGASCTCGCQDATLAVQATDCLGGDECTCTPATCNCNDK